MCPSVINLLQVPGVLYLAIKYINDPGRALGVNAALSGDNCNRGSLLGAILGCAGARLPEYLTKGLYVKQHAKIFLLSIP